MAVMWHILMQIEEIKGDPICFSISVVCRKQETKTSVQRFYSSPAIWLNLLHFSAFCLFHIHVFLCGRIHGFIWMTNVMLIIKNTAEWFQFSVVTGHFRPIFVSLLNTVLHFSNSLIYFVILNWYDRSVISTAFPLKSSFFITGNMVHVRLPSGWARVCMYQWELYLLLHISFGLFQRSCLSCNFKAVSLTAAQGMWDWMSV